MLLSVDPDDYGFVWHFGRWQVSGVKIEIAHIVAPEGFPTSDDGAGIWEAGPEIWPYIQKASFADRAIPVVPLEIQLQTNLSRGLTERATEIVSILRRDGCDGELIRKALSREQWSTWWDSSLTNLGACPSNTCPLRPTANERCCTSPPSGGLPGGGASPAPHRSPVSNNEYVPGGVYQMTIDHRPWTTIYLPLILTGGLP